MPAGEGVLQDALDACLKTGMLQESDPVVVVQQMLHKLDAWVSRFVYQQPRPSAISLLNDSRPTSA